MHFNYLIFIKRTDSMTNFFQEFVNRFFVDFSFWDLFLTALGAATTFILKIVWDYFRSSKGEYTGTWQQIIPPYQNEPEKIAIVKIKQLGDKLICKTVRTVPKLEFKQEWRFECRIKRNLIFGIYWPKDGSRIPGSYGTLQFHIVNDNLFEGFYVRAQHNSSLNAERQFVDKLNTIPLKWERVHNSKK